MKKHFKLIDLDCANCAAKMEAAIKKLDGVQSQLLGHEILNEVVKVCKKVEPDCTIVR